MQKIKRIKEGIYGLYNVQGRVIQVAKRHRLGWTAMGGLFPTRQKAFDCMSLKRG